MTQTAVEWLAERYNTVTWLRNRDEVSEGMADEMRKDYLEQAKQMEKEQHEDTWLDSRIEINDEDYIAKEKSFEQYYNETYGGKP